MLDTNKDFVHLNAVMPRIALNVQNFWGYQECPDYINQILNDTRDGKRLGFPQDVASCLIRLLVLHDTMYPSIRHNTKAPFKWDDWFS